MGGVLNRDERTSSARRLATVSCRAPTECVASPLDGPTSVGPDASRLELPERLVTCVSPRGTMPNPLYAPERASCGSPSTRSPPICENN